ncbi:hypothetical protein ACF1BA_33090 [Streptomyces rubiginosohelvolus]|uniref:hypothetical protein n=1 Tax=Streptomyces rubiginosohelvolus TaxID=67362 RepID=UPI0036FD0EBD
MKAALARLAPRLYRPDRYQVVQSLKAAAAAIIAWALTGWWLEAPMALMAPWAAVALVQGTVYRSLRTAVQIVLMITAGTLLAAGAATFTGNTMIAVAVALPLATLLGNWLPSADRACTRRPPPSSSSREPALAERLRGRSPGPPPDRPSQQTDRRELIASPARARGRSGRGTAPRFTHRPSEARLRTPNEMIFEVIGSFRDRRSGGAGWLGRSRGKSKSCGR